MTEALAAVVQWWDQHGYVGGASGDTGVGWNFVPDRQRQLIADWARKLNPEQVAAIKAGVPAATRRLAEAVLPR
jgi:hypothetical protein